MNSKKARALRKQAKAYTPHLPELNYNEDGRLGECRRGAYQALKRGAVKHVLVDQPPR